MEKNEKLFNEHREECYRCFKIGNLEIRIYSPKYAFRELQSMIRITNDKIAELDKELQKIESKEQQLESLLCDIIRKIDDGKERTVKLESLIEELKKEVSEQSEENVKIIESDVDLVMKDCTNQINEKINSVKRELCVRSEDEIQRLKVNMPNAYVHLSAYAFRGNAGDNILVTALRNSIEKSLNQAFSWVHRPVRAMLNDDTVEMINASNGVIIGGGGLFLCDTNRNEVSGWQWPCSLNELDRIKVPMYIIGVGYNRFRNQEEFSPVFKDNINEVVRKCEFVGLRNTGSVKAIQQYLDDDELKSKVVFHPCATTVLKHIYRMPEIDNSQRPVIAVNCAFDRSNLRYGERKEEILLAIARCLKKYETEYEIRYYSHMKPDKEALSYFDKVELQYKVFELDQGLTTDEFLNIYSEPTLVLAMRGHAQLIPFGCGTPVLSVITHDKLQWFLEDIDHQEWGVDVLDDCFEEKLSNTMMYMLDNNDDIKKQIDVAQEKLWKIVKNNITNHFKAVYCGK